jgi:hypothetical protein
MSVSATLWEMVSTFTLLISCSCNPLTYHLLSLISSLKRSYRSALADFNCFQFQSEQAGLGCKSREFYLKAGYGRDLEAQDLRHWQERKIQTYLSLPLDLTAISRPILSQKTPYTRLPGHAASSATRTPGSSPLASANALRL